MFTQDFRRIAFILMVFIVPRTLIIQCGNLKRLKSQRFEYKKLFYDNFYAF